MEDSLNTLFLDIETTGLAPHIEVPGKRPGTTKKEQVPYETGFMDYPYVVSMAWKMNLDGETYHCIINQEGREIPQESTDIHGITNEMANESIHTFESVIQDFISEVSVSHIVVGHGIYFDTSIIKANVLRSIKLGKLDEINYPNLTDGIHKHKRIDTMRKTAKMMGKWPTLQELHMKIFRKGFDHHNAKNDVEALARCYEWLFRKGIVPTYEELQEKALAEA